MYTPNNFSIQPHLIFVKSHKTTKPPIGKGWAVGIIESFRGFEEFKHGAVGHIDV